MYTHFTLRLFLVGTLLLSTSSLAKVEVTINETVYTYSTNPRLSDVLRPVAFQESWYWPNTQLFSRNTNQAQELRQQIVKMLAIQSKENKKHQAIYGNIAKQLENWEIADRVAIQIDYELSRISPKNNPLFEDGLYQVFLTKRPTNIKVFGAIDKELVLPFKNNTCVKDIVSTITFSDYADKSYVYLISPQGQIEKSPIAYWNNKCTIPMPGSALYVPLQENFFSKVHGVINRDILALAVDRINIR
jgi:hypothetical protein